MIRIRGSCLAASLLLVWSASLEAQPRRPAPGTFELGVFGQYTALNGDLDLENALGGGALLGFFFSRRLSTELELTYAETDREAGGSALYRTQSGRVNLNFPTAGRSAFVLGAGAVRSDYGGADHWGPTALAGIRWGLGDRLSLRTSAVVNVLTPVSHVDIGGRIGLSLLFGGRIGPDPDSLARARADSIARARARADSIAAAAARERARADSIAAAERARADSIRAEEERRRRGMEALRTTLTREVYFDFDRSSLTDEARARLDEKLPLLRANPAVRIRVVGHADERGSDEYNLALGQRRANSVKRYLVNAGIASDRIDITSMGEEEPVCTEDTEACWARNRRDEFVITAGGDMLRAPARE